jgi:hypothetical protein
MEEMEATVIEVISIFSSQQVSNLMDGERRERADDEEKKGEDWMEERIHTKNKAEMRDTRTRHTRRFCFS